MAASCTGLICPLWYGGAPTHPPACQCSAVKQGSESCTGMCMHHVAGVIFAHASSPSQLEACAVPCSGLETNRINIAVSIQRLAAARATLGVRCAARPCPSCICMLRRMPAPDHQMLYAYASLLRHCKLLISRLALSCRAVQHGAAQQLLTACACVLIVHSLQQRHRRRRLHPSACIQHDMR